uniref:STAS domain-containing protein n=1 Tax=Leersia perrieri TaxID=77586 RepID=A0A0D9WAF4_9ORYZ
MAARAIADREEAVAKLEGEKASLEKLLAVREKEQAQEASELQTSMIETMEAVEMEKQRHHSTRMEALARLAKLEVTNAELAKSLAREQWNLDLQVDQVAQLREEVDLKTFTQDKYKRKIAKMQKTSPPLVDEIESLRRFKMEEEMIDAEYALTCDRIVNLKDKARKIEENIELTKRRMVHPTEVEIELKKRLDQLTDRLIQKQMQVESLSSEKAALLFRIEAVSRSLDNNGSSLASSSSSSKIDIEAGTWQESHSPRLRDRIRNGQRQLGSAIRQLDSIFSAGHIFLRRNPKALVWALVYLVCLHIWVLYILTSHPTISEARPGATFSLESLNKTAYGYNGNTTTNNNNNNDEDKSGHETVTTAMEISAAMSVAHKVSAPPAQSTASKMKVRVKETFFPDDPFRGFKGKPLKTKWLMAVQYLFPILEWGISYAKLASLPPIIGLYSSFVPPMVYAVLGSSRDLAVGPVSIASLIMGSMLRQAVSPAADPLLFLQLAFTSTFFAGLVQASLGILRLGFIIDFLSKATLVGFMAGAAIIVSLQQLKALLGIVHFTTEMGLVPVMASVVRHTNELSWQTILMGACFLVLLLTARHVRNSVEPLKITLTFTLQEQSVQSMKWPKLFWISACAPLACVIVSTLLVFLFKAQKHGISIIGQLKCGLNRPSWDKLLFDPTYLGLTVKTGLVTGIISLTEGVAVGRTFASLKDYQVDGNKEMMAIGLMNIVGSCTSCYVTTGAFSRSAVNHNAGCKTAMSNVIMALTVMVTLLFLMPLFVYTPNVVLGAIIIAAVIGLIDLPAVYNIWKMDKMDFLVCVCAFAGVIFISVQEGLAIAVGISIFRVLLQITRPKMMIQGNIKGTDIYRNLLQYKEAQRVPGFLILTVEAPINFANTNYLNERVKRWIEEESSAGNKQSELHFVILDLSAVPAIDTSGISFLIDLKKSTEKRGLELILVNPTGEVMEKIQRVNDAHGHFKSDSLYLTTGEAVASLSVFSKMTAP